MSLAKKVNKLSKDGMKIKDISVVLNMSLKDTYRYLKIKMKISCYIFRRMDKLTSSNKKFTSSLV